MDTPKPLQPHLYEVAPRMYLLIRRRNKSQALLSRYVAAAVGTRLSLTLLQRHMQNGQVVFVVNQILPLVLSKPSYHP